MPLRRTVPPDPLVVARLGQVLPPAEGGWVPPAPEDEVVEAAAPAGSRRHAPEPGPSVLDTWRAGRVSPGLRGALALGLVALLAVALTGAVVVRGRPQELAPPPVVASGLPVPGTSADRPAEGPEVVVAVGGRVRRPGLVRLPAGSRVDDAVREAGGATRSADLALVNLARRLMDG